MHVGFEYFHVDSNIICLEAIETRHQRDVSPRNRRSERLTDFAFPLGQLRWELEDRAEEPVVDRPNLDGHTRAAHGPLRGPEAGHASHHWKNPKLLCCNEIINSKTPSARRSIATGAASRIPESSGTAQ